MLDPFVFDKKGLFLPGADTTVRVQRSRNRRRVLLGGMIGAAACYLIAGFSTGVILPFFACILTGMFTAMLWPGTLILMEENIPSAGVAAYALMAAGGDLGASVAPQLMGIVIDKVSASNFAAGLAASSGLSSEQHVDRAAPTFLKMYQFRLNCYMYIISPQLPS